jgi:hypothetical protein
MGQVNEHRDAWVDLCSLDALKEGQVQTRSFRKPLLRHSEPDAELAHVRGDVRKYLANARAEHGTRLAVSRAGI